ncbi:transposase, partial [Streptococcus pneumoniae]
MELLYQKRSRDKRKIPCLVNKGFLA